MLAVPLRITFVATVVTESKSGALNRKSPILNPNWVSPPTFKALEDQSFLAEGANPASDVYEAIVKFKENAAVAAVRLEALPHEALPGKGSSPEA